MKSSKNMKTWVSDTFPLKKLECQYFDICKYYDPNNCMYTDPCELRNWFRDIIESYIPRKSLELQIKLIIEEDGKKKDL